MLLAIPLDDRPVNVEALPQLAAIAGLRVLTPPRALLGRFRKPGCPDALIDWLSTHLPIATGLLLSIDMLCYGGLVASRTPAVSQHQALARLTALESLLRHRRVPAFATSVLLRQSTTVSDEASLHRWRRLFELMALPGDRRDAALAAETDPAFSAEVRDHLAARARNHAINRRCIELAARGTFDHLAILKEDCSPEGIHRLEEAGLLALGKELDVDSRVSLEPGADEGSMMLLARHALESARLTPALAVDYVPAQLADTIALYEDRAIGRTIPSQLALCGFTAHQDARLRLCVVSGVPTGSDLFVQAPHTRAAAGAPWPRARDAAAQLLGSDLARTDFWGLADVGMANGADPALAQELLDCGLARSAAAFAGWNTAANTTGSALAHLAMLAIPSRGSPSRRRAQARYLLTRWIDDFVFQGLVRREILDAARAASANPYDLGRHGRPLTSLLRERLRAESGRRLARLLRVPLPAPGGPMKLAKLPHIDARFPWNRAFEIEIRLTEVEIRDV